MPAGLREAEPLKITSSIAPPRSDLADCSPRTHLMASTTLDFPQPLGPTMPTSGASKAMSVLSAKDLKPLTVSLERRMMHALRVVKALPRLSGCRPASQLILSAISPHFLQLP